MSDHISASLVRHDRVRENSSVTYRVGSATVCSSLATAIVKAFEEGNRRVVLSCIGAASVNCGIKAVAVAMGFVAPQGWLLLIAPAFMEKANELGKDVTSINLHVSRVAL